MGPLCSTSPCFHRSLNMKMHWKKKLFRSEWQCILAIQLSEQSPFKTLLARVRKREYYLNCVYQVKPQHLFLITSIEIVTYVGSMQRYQGCVITHHQSKKMEKGSLKRTVMSPLGRIIFLLKDCKRGIFCIKCIGCGLFLTSQYTHMHICICMYEIIFTRKS